LGAVFQYRFTKPTDFWEMLYPVLLNKKYAANTNNQQKWNKKPFKKTVSGGAAYTALLRGSSGILKAAEFLFDAQGLFYPLRSLPA
jgi:hypothetical protein